MRTDTILTTTFLAYTCPECGVAYALGEEFDRRRRYDGKSFFCPNGHSLSYKGDEAELRRKLAAAKGNERFANERLETERKRSAAYKGQVTKIKRRVGKGVCPCCNRTFANLAKHMEGQHPEFVEEG